MAQAKAAAQEMSDVCKQVLARIDRERQNPLPTPPKGKMVGWIDRPQRYRQKGGLVGVVTAQIAPGRIDVEIFGENQKMVRRGAIYIEHPDLINRASTQMGPGGCWYYIEVEGNQRFKPPKEDYEWHLKQLDQQEERALEDEKRRKKQEEERKLLDERVNQGV